MSDTVASSILGTPPWDEDSFDIFMKRLKWASGDGTDRYDTMSYIQDHFEFLQIIRDRLAPVMTDSVTHSGPARYILGRAHYTLGRPPTIDYVTFRDPDVDNVWEAQRLAWWDECPLLRPDMGEAFVRRWKIAGTAIGMQEDGTGRRLTVGMQVHLVPPQEGPAALARGAGYVLVCAAWALAASWWQCGTRVGIALLNTSFTRLAIVNDEDGTHVLVVEQAGATPDNDADTHTDVSQLAETHSLAHDFFPRGQLDRDAFGLYWDALARGYLVALWWTREIRQVVQQARAEMDAEDAEAGDDSGVENGAEENGYHDDGDDDDDNSDDSDDSDDYEPHSDASSASSILGDRRFDYNAAYYDDVPRLVESLARMFPRYRVVSPAEMTALVERALPTETPGGPLDDVELPSI